MRNISKAEQNFLMEKVIPYYLIYSKKDGSAYCQRCDSEFGVELLGKTKPASDTICPICNKKVRLKIKYNIGKYNTNQIMGTGIIPDSDNGNFVLRYFDIVYHYDNENKKIKNKFYRECARENYYSDGTFETEDRKYNEDNFRRCRLRNNDYCMSWMTHRMIGMHVNISNGFVGLYDRNFSKYLCDSKFGHIDFSKLLKNYKIENWYDLHYLITSLYESDEYRLYIEYLIKCNLIGIAQTSFNTGCKLYLEEKSLIDMLGIKKEQYKKLDENSTISDVLRYRKLNKFNISESDYEIFDKYLAKEFDGNIEKLLKVFPYSLKKFAKYEESFKKYNKHYIDLPYYNSYLGMCIELGLDMKNTFVSIPRDLVASHDMVTDMYNEMMFDIKLSESANKANEFANDYAKTVDKNKELFSYEEDELKIVVPENTKEIGIEGYQLRHCVAKYVEDIVNNEKVVLFIRNKTDICKPFFTVSIVGNMIEECKGYRNSKRPENVEMFIKNFARNKHLIINREETFAAVM